MNRIEKRDSLSEASGFPTQSSGTGAGEAGEAGAGGREEAVLAAKFVHPPVSPLIGSLRNNAEA